MDKGFGEVTDNLTIEPILRLLVPPADLADETHVIPRTFVPDWQMMML